MSVQDWCRVCGESDNEFSILSIEEAGEPHATLMCVNCINQLIYDLREEVVSLRHSIVCCGVCLEGISDNEW